MISTMEVEEIPKSESREENQEDLTLMLHDEVLIYIFTMLPIMCRIKIQRVCKRWQVLSKMAWYKQKVLLVSDETYEEVECPYSLPILRQVLGLCGKYVIEIHIDLVDEETDYNSLTIVKILKKFCPRLKKVNLHTLILSRETLEYLTNHFSELVGITFGTCECEDSLRTFFSACRNLYSVGLVDSSNLTGICFDQLPFESIHKFLISLCNDIKIENLQKALKYMNNLEYLDMCGSLKCIESLDETLPLLPDKSKLISLALDSTIMDSQTVVKMTSLRDLTNLQLISLRGCMVAHDGALETLAKYCKNLKEMLLSNSNDVTDKGLTKFVNSLNIENLRLASLPRITDKSVVNMILRASIKVLICFEIPLITSRGLGSLISSVQNLERVEIVKCENVNSNILVQEAIKATDNRQNNKTLKLVVNQFFDKVSTMRIAKNLVVEDLHGDCWR